MRKSIGGAVFALAISVSAGGSVQAATFFQNFTGGLTEPDITLTFSEVSVPANTLITDQYSSFGVTFTNTVSNPQDGFFPRDFAGNFGGGLSAVSSVTISFSNAVDSAAVELLTNSGTSSFAAYLGSDLVGSGSASTSTVLGHYLGFTGGLFDRFVISAGGFNNAMLFDNLQFSAAVAETPVPAALPLFASALGLGGLFGYRRKRKAAMA
jgi:hypothetical protein